MPFGDRVCRPKTLMLAVPEQLRSGSKVDFVKKIVDAVTGQRVAAVQFMPNYFVRVTFGTTQDRHDVFRLGIEIDGVKIPLIEAESAIRSVCIHHCPVEVSDNSVKEVLSGFGDVESVESVYYDGTAILTGSRIVKMAVRDEIPPKIYVYRYPCRVWYRDQPCLCLICESPEHRASVCPLRDKCRKCRQPGHFARDCTASPEAPVGDPPSSSVDVPASNPSAESAPAASCPPVEMDVSESPATADDSLAPDPDRRSTKRFRSVSESSHSTFDDIPTSVSSDAPCQSFDVPPPSVPPSGTSPEDVLKSVSPNALVLHEGDRYEVIDLGRLTRRCVMEGATPEMYRECFYLDPTIKDVLPVMSVFPPGRDVPPASFPAKSTPAASVAENSDPVELSDPVPASSAPSKPTDVAAVSSAPVSFPTVAVPVQSVLSSSPMSTAVPFESSKPQWCTRLPLDFHRLLAETNHSNGCHIVRESYLQHDRTRKVFSTVYDFGENTYRFLCDQFSFDELRSRSYPRAMKTKSDFPGPAAVDLPCLAADVAPSGFPAPPPDSAKS